MRPLSQLGSKESGSCAFCVVLQRASAAWIETSNNGCFNAIVRGNQRDDHKSNHDWRNLVAIDVAPIGRASADGRAAHSITGLTGCNPTCIAAPAASLGKWLDAQEGSSATAVPHFGCRAGVRPIISHPILQRSQTPTGGELRGDHHQQRDDQNASVYTASGTVLFGASFISCFRPTATRPAVGPSPMRRFSRLSGNATTGMSRFAFVVSAHIGDALWLGARLHDGCISVQSGAPPATFSPVEKRRLGYHGSTSQDVTQQYEAVLCNGS